MPSLLKPLRFPAISLWFPLLLIGFGAGSVEPGYEQTGRLLPAEPLPGLSFGGAVVIDGDTAAVAAPGWEHKEHYPQGAVYVFTRGPSGWTQQGLLMASDGEAFDHFGASVALQGDVLAVGAPGVSDEFSSDENGAVYVFTREHGIWTEHPRLTVPYDGGDYILEEFGSALALDGDTLLAGAHEFDLDNNWNEAAYVFARDGDDWIQQAKLTAGSDEFDFRYEYDVALSGDTALIGTPYETVGPNVDQGQVYVFRREGVEWTPAGTFTPADAGTDDQFGCSLDLDGDAVIVAACQYDANDHSGDAYIFVRQGESWSQQARLIPQLEDDQPLSVDSVALDGETAVLGAPYVDTAAAPVSGAVYVYQRAGNTWAFQLQLVGDNTEQDDRFGRGIDVSDSVILAGAPSITHLNNINQGMAYLFEIGPERPYATYLPFITYPAFFDTSSPIIYSKTDDTLNGDIYIIRPDGGSKTNLTQSPQNEISPVWSPDGKRIAYIRVRENYREALMTMNADGSDRRVIIEDIELGFIGSPAWSPDGTRIAFTGYDSDSGYDLYAIELDGRSLTNLTAHLPGNPTDPAWSPDGTKIAFSYEHLAEFGWTIDLAVMDVDGGEATLLTDDRGSQDNADWSPDGSKILYTHSLNGIPNLYAIPADGGVPQLVVHSGTTGRWSPDGAQIVFTAWGTRVFRADADGGNVTPVDASWEASLGDW